MSVNLSNKRLKLFDTQEIFPLHGTDFVPISRGPGSETIKFLIEGNSLISTVFVKAIDPGTTVRVTYKEPSTGANFGESFTVKAHPDLTSTGPNRQTITRIHNRPECVLEIIGGSAEVGILVTVVSSFASDLDAALKLDEQAIDFAIDKGLPQVFYDSDESKWFLAKGDNGVQLVKDLASGEVIGTLIKLINTTSTGLDETSPGSVQDLIDETVPADVIWRVIKAQVNCRASGEYEITDDGAIIGHGLTSRDNLESIFLNIGSDEVDESSALKLSYRGHSASPQTKIMAFVWVIEIPK